MTFKEELEAQGKRLAEAQRRYFAGRAKSDGGRDESSGGEVFRPGRALTRGAKFYGGNEVPGGAGEPEYRVHPEIVRFARERFYCGGKVPNGPVSQGASGLVVPPPRAGPGDEAPPPDELKGFTINVVIAKCEDAPPCPRPPLDAEFMLHLLLRHDEHDALIGDLVERYGRKRARLGARRANLWFYAEVLWTALPLLKRALIEVSGLVAFGEWVRRHVL